MSDGKFELPEVVEEATEEYEVDFSTLRDADVILLCKGLTDAERALILGKDDAVVEYAARLARAEANGNKDVNFAGFVAELVEGRRDANYARGVQAEI